MRLLLFECNTVLPFLSIVRRCGTVSFSELLVSRAEDRLEQEAYRLDPVRSSVAATLPQLIYWVSQQLSASRDAAALVDGWFLFSVSLLFSLRLLTSTLLSILR